MSFFLVLEAKLDQPSEDVQLDLVKQIKAWAYACLS